MRLARVRCTLYLLRLVRVNRIWPVVCRDRVPVRVCIRVGSGAWRTICVRADIGGMRRNYSWPMERARPLCCRDSRVPAIGRGEQCTVLARFLYVLGLRRGHRCMVLPLG